VNVSKAYGPVKVCREIDLTIADREFVDAARVFGCGKTTTTLNMIGGLDAVTSGDILMDGRRVNDLEPIDRDVAMVFQNYALYPHMTVHRYWLNLKLRVCVRPTLRPKCLRPPASLDLTHLLDRYPKASCQAAEQQRVSHWPSHRRQPRVFLSTSVFKSRCRIAERMPGPRCQELQ